MNRTVDEVQSEGAPPAMPNAAAKSVGDPSPDEADGAAAGRAANRAADRALVGCLYFAGVLGIAAFFYFGFFVFAILDDRNEWGLLEPYLDERTSEILYAIYWPLIHLYLWLGWQ